MRRLTATVLTIGSLVAGLGAITDPAYAAAPRKWTALDAYGKVNAWGTYARFKNKVVVRGNLQDLAKDGWTACVEVLTTESGEGYRKDRFKMTVDLPKGKYYHFDGRGRVSLLTSSPNTGHLYVRECRRNKQTAKWSYGKYRKLY